MENENVIDAGTGYQSNQLTVSPAASVYLTETGRWAKFLAVLGFCFVALVVIGGLFAGSILSSMGGPLPYPSFAFGLIYVVIGLVYFFPVYYLFKFATQLKPALQDKNSSDLESAFENLKSHYKFIGILMIITLGLYVLGGGLALIGAAFL